MSATDRAESAHNERMVRREQVAIMYRQSLMAFVSTIVALIGCLVGLKGQVDPVLLAAWGFVVAAINLYLLFIRALYYRSDDHSRDTNVFDVLFNLQAVVHGCSWGALVPLVWYSGASDLFLAFAVMVTLGLAAGSIMTTGSVYRVFLSFTLAAALPPVPVLLMTGSQVWITTGVLIFAYSAALSTAAWVYYCSIRDSLTLRYHNDDLLQRLLAEKGRSDSALTQLQQEIETRRSAEESLSNAKQAAEAANEAKSRFLANMTHEIRTPLTAILGFSEMLDEEKNNPQQLSHHIDAIGRNGRHLLRIINEVLDFSKIEAGHMEVERVPVELFPFLEEIKATYGYLIQEKGLAFSLQCHYPLPARIYTDPTRLKQIVFNLLSNALKFTAVGTIKVDVAYARSDSSLFISVTDSGVGMSQDEVGKLFRPFTQADASTTRHYGGTGLGLSISRRLANLLDGGLEVSTEKGKGSCFTLTLRTGVRDDADILWRAPATQDSGKQPQESGVSFSGRVLLVEDNRDIQVLVGCMVRKLGPEVTLAENGLQALEVLAKQRFDLVLLDMQMPVMDGLETLRRMRAGGDLTPVVALTANAMEEDRMKFLQSGASDFIAKPVDRSDLRKMMASLLPEQDAGSDEDDEDAQLVAEFRARFLAGLPEYLQRLQQYRKTADYGAMQFLVHDLKGMGGSFGFPEISRVSGDIEQLLKQGLRDGLEALLDEMVQICETVSVH